MSGGQDHKMALLNSENFQARLRARVIYNSFHQNCKEIQTNRLYHLSDQLAKSKCMSESIQEYKHLRRLWFDSRH